MKSSDNQQQHLLLGQRWIIGNTMWIWLSTSSQTRILDLWNKVYQILESLTAYVLKYESERGIIKYWWSFSNFTWFETEDKRNIDINTKPWHTSIRSVSLMKSPIFALYKTLSMTFSTTRKYHGAPSDTCKWNMTQFVSYCI